MPDSQINITLGTYKRQRIIAISALDSIFAPMKIVNNQSVLAIIFTYAENILFVHDLLHFPLEIHHNILIATKFFVIVKAIRGSQ